MGRGPIGNNDFNIARLPANTQTKNAQRRPGSVIERDMNPDVFSFGMFEVTDNGDGTMGLSLIDDWDFTCDSIAALAARVTALENRLDVSTLLLYEQDTTTRTFNTTGGTGWTTSAFTVPAESKIKVDIALPCRNDSASWGGGYIEWQYEINGSGTWISLGDSGYDAAVMTSGGDNIATYTNNFVLDFSSETSAISVKLRYRARSYDATLNVNGSHGIGTYASPTSGVAYSYSHVIVMLLDK